MEAGPFDLATLQAAYVLAMSAEDPGNENNSGEDQTTDTGGQQDRERESPCGERGSPREERDSPCDHEQRESLSEDRESPCEQRESPCEQRESPGEKRESPSEERESPCEERESPCEQRESPCEQRESPCEERESPCEQKESPCEERESPCEEGESPCKETRSEESTRRGHVCSHCGYTTSRLANLSVHMKKHTGGNPYHLDQSEKMSDDDETNNREDTDTEWQQDKERQSQYDSEETCSVGSTQSDEGTDELEEMDIEYHHLPDNANNREVQATNQAGPSYRCGQCDHLASSQDGLKAHMAYHLCKCDLCSFSTTSKQELRQHISEHTADKPYIHSCGRCDFKTLHKSQLTKHMKTHPVEECPHKCDICGFVTTSKQELQQHISQHNEQYIHSCKHCDFKTVYKSQLSTHIKNVHDVDDYPYQCDQCRYATTQKNFYDKHMLKVHSKPHVCWCGFRTADSSFLLVHMATHTGQITYKCDQCDFIALSQHTLKQHTKATHNYKCRQCDHIESSQEGLKAHMAFHLLKCGTCKFSTPSLQDFKQHLSQHVYKPYIYSCGQCDFRTDYKSQLATHIRSLHTPDEFPHKCDQCSYAARQKSFLDKHMLKHTKPHVCWCGFRTADKSQLVVHRATHTGEVTFKCDECDFSTLSEDSWEQHEATLGHTLANWGDVSTSSKNKNLKKHSGEKPYLFSCEKCEFKTDDGSQVYPHMMTHAEKKPPSYKYKCDQCSYIASKSTF
ncbi:hypothetical protein Bbelb_091060 [Branchiostoma belcheri]|nr:hypothetical protein Bbelb_091060 [Branchiostoma belcheri]